MYNKLLKILPYIGLILVLFGILMISFNYFTSKKDQTYKNMGVEIYDYYSKIKADTEVVNEVDDETKNEETIEKEEIVEESKPQQNYYVGYLEIPKIKFKRGFASINSPHNNLNENIQVIEGSNYPDVTDGNFILAGHSGSSSRSFFNDLVKLSYGDKLYIDYNGKRYTYEVYDIYTVLKNGEVSIKRKDNITMVTLITCVRNNNSKQMVILAKRI